jgi:hypothetical protein
VINWGNIPLGTVLPFPFASYGKTNGESITLTGLAVTDVEVYKGVSMTQRASDAGYVLLDTDGIDIDGTTGIHAFSIDTGDNTDAGFFVAGSLYWVIVSAVTVDSQTVNFVAGTFRLVAAESVAGVMEADTTHLAGQAVTAAAGVTFPSSIASAADMALVLARLVGIAVTTGSVTTDAGNSAISFETDRTETANDYWKDAFLLLTSGTLTGQVKKVTAYNGTTKIITVQDGFTATPADGVTFAIINR